MTIPIFFEISSPYLVRLILNGSNIHYINQFWFIIDKSHLILIFLQEFQIKNLFRRFFLLRIHIYVHTCVCVWLFIFKCVCVCVCVYKCGWSELRKMKHWHPTLSDIFAKNYMKISWNNKDWIYSKNCHWLPPQPPDNYGISCSPFRQSPYLNC